MHPTLIPDALNWARILRVDTPLFSRCSTVDPFRLNSAHHLYALAQPGREAAHTMYTEADYTVVCFGCLQGL